MVLPKLPTKIVMTHKTLVFLFSTLLLMFVAIGCGSEDSGPQIVRVVETVEVPVTVIVQQAVDAVSVDSSNGEAAVVSAEPTPTVFPTLVPTPVPTGQPGDFDSEDLNKLFEIWDLIESDFYGSLPADEVLEEAIIQAVVEQLGDDFTNYFPPAVAQRIQDGFRGDFTGIGAYVNTNDLGQFYIVRPIPNTPAAAAGLQPDDVVLNVDGDSIQGMVTDEVVAIVRGPEGADVVLTILREGEPEPFDVTITRARIIVPQVEAKVIGDTNIGYVSLASFNQVATEQLEAEIQGLLAAGIEGLIFDLRFNGGGLLTQSVSVGDLFLKDGTFLIVRDSEGNIETWDTEDGQLAEDIPLVLLVNDSSASASEIVAGAFRDLDRATIIGVNTFGKGSVQTPYQLDDGSEFRVTTARFFSPADVEINGVGVAPDIVFEFTPDILGDESDETVQRAIEFLKTGQ